MYPKVKHQQFKKTTSNSKPQKIPGGANVEYVFQACVGVIILVPLAMGAKEVQRTFLLLVETVIYTLAAHDLLQSLLFGISKQQLPGGRSSAAAVIGPRKSCLPYSSSTGRSDRSCMTKLQQQSKLIQISQCCDMGLLVSLSIVEQAGYSRKSILECGQKPRHTAIVGGIIVPDIGAITPATMV